MNISETDMTGATGWLTIGLEALADNYRLLASRVAPARQLAVKSDAYGLGAFPVSASLYRAGCRDFFVAQYHEAIRLRPELPAHARILVPNGLQPGAEARAAELGLIPVLNSLEQVSVTERGRNGDCSPARASPLSCRKPANASRVCCRR